MNTLLERFLAVPLWQRILLQAMILLGGAALWYNFVYLSIDKDISRTRRDIKKLTKQIADNNTARKNAEEIQKRIDKITEELTSIQDRLPANAELGDLLQKIHGQAKIVGLQIARFEREDAVDENLYIRIPVKMTLRGSFHHIATFFYYVGNLTRIVNVENIQLSVLDRKSDGPELEAQCTATTFVYRTQGGAQ
ncbi:MAG: type 4a pilus biogenesis protein PilO [Bradymonadia bacterium]